MGVGLWVVGCESDIGGLQVIIGDSWLLVVGVGSG